MYGRQTFTEMSAAVKAHKPVYADDVQEESSAGQENTDIEESGAQAGIETM